MDRTHAHHHHGHDRGHDHGDVMAGGPPAMTWSVAALATLHCLAGCAIGEVLALAFVVTVPVDRVLIGRGKGHAVVHGYH